MILWTGPKARDRIGQLVTDSGSPMSTADRLSSTAKAQAYRARLRAAGGAEVLFQLPVETVACSTKSRNATGCRTAARRYCN